MMRICDAGLCCGICVGRHPFSRAARQDAKIGDGLAVLREEAGFAGDRGVPASVLAIG